MRVRILRNFDSEFDIFYIDKKTMECPYCKKNFENSKHIKLCKIIVENVTGKKYGVSDNAIKKWIKKY